MKNFQQKRLTGKIPRCRCGMAGWSLALVCFCIILFGNVQIVSAQTRNVTIDVVDTPIGKVFDELSKQTRYKIFYSDNVIDSKQKVSVNFVNKPLKEEQSQTWMANFLWRYRKILIWQFLTLAIVIRL